MKYGLFEEIVPDMDIPQKKLKKGDVAMVAECYSVSVQEPSLTLPSFSFSGSGSPGQNKEQE